jgi:hypothetical protein
MHIVAFLSLLIGPESYHSSSVMLSRKKPRSFDRLRMTGVRRRIREDTGEEMRVDCS